MLQYGTAMTMLHYRAYGLNIASPFHFPELQLTSAPAEVTIRYGEVPHRLSYPIAKAVFYQAEGDQFLLNMDKLAIARYLVCQGQEIIVKPSPGSDKDSIRLFLLDSCMAAVCYQRSLIPLHGSAVQTKHGAVIFVGESGVGKSTLAATFQQRGYPILADDLSVIKLDETGKPWVMPGQIRLKLWRDVLDRMGHDIKGLNPVRPKLEKYSLPLESSYGVDPVPLHKVYVLNTHNHDECRLQRVTGVKKLGMLDTYLYRRSLSYCLTKRTDLLYQLSTVAQQAAMGHLHRSRTFSLDALVTCIEADLG